MLIRKKKLEKSINCAKCSTKTEISLNQVDVNKFPAGCGIWINQSELDLNRRSKSLLASVVPDQPAGLWRARRFAGR